MSTVIYKPYTYLIGWSTHKIWYYGVRFAKGCNPCDLWNPYKTSSKYVKRFIERYGEPDVIQVRKTFETAEKAQRWEENVLRKMRVVSRNDFLNKTDTNRIKSEAITNGLKKYWANLTPNERSERSAKAVSAMLSAPKNPIDPQKRSEWVKRYWYSMSFDERSKVNQKSRRGSIEYYKKLTAEEKTERAKKAVTATPTLTCPHCNKSGKKGNMYRWHFDNCKNR